MPVGYGAPELVKMRKMELGESVAVGEAAGVGHAGRV